MLSAFRICSPTVSGTKNGGTVPYKAILPCISLTNRLTLGESLHLGYLKPLMIAGWLVRGLVPNAPFGIGQEEETVDGRLPANHLIW